MSPHTVINKLWEAAECGVPTTTSQIFICSHLWCLSGNQQTLEWELAGDWKISINSCGELMMNKMGLYIPWWAFRVRWRIRRLVRQYRYGLALKRIQGAMIGRLAGDH